MELTLYDYVINIVGVIIVPICMMITASRWADNPPEYKNGGVQLSGYKTPGAMKSKETWNFSQKYYWGWVENLSLWVLVGSVVLIIRNISATHFIYEMLIIIGIQVVIFLLPAVLTEIKLRQQFDELGKPKKQDNN